MSAVEVIDNFKSEFKYYKQKAVTPSFENVIDFEHVSTLDGKVSKVELPNASRTWEIYSVNDVSGLYFAKGIFSDEEQKHWAKKCVKDFTVSPYSTNLDPFQSKESIDTAWSDSVEAFKSCNEKRDFDFLKTTPIWKIRWSTIGYHHNWNTRRYERESKSDFPSELANICSEVFDALGFKNYTPEAAIINYYHVGSTLSPHKDISEADLTIPLFSISLGLDAIFLIGGEEKDIKPIPLLLRSGDVLIMSGKARTAYHAVPRIMPSTRLKFENDDFLSFYLQNARININIRQVESEEHALSY
ncbi:nucleic acid dioxygenase ALKBH1-like [Styela clava]